MTKDDAARSCARYIRGNQDAYKNFRSHCLCGGNPRDHIFYHAGTVLDVPNNCFREIEEYELGVDSRLKKHISYLSIIDKMKVIDYIENSILPLDDTRGVNV